MFTLMNHFDVLTEVKMNYGGLTRTSRTRLNHSTRLLLVNTVGGWVGPKIVSHWFYFVSWWKMNRLKESRVPCSKPLN